MSEAAPPRPRRAAIALGLGVPLLLGLLVVEGGTRMLLEQPGFSPANREGSSGLLQELPDSPRQFGYHAGIERQVGGGDEPITVRINSRGFRDSEWDPIRQGAVLAVGDSFTAGWGVDQEEGWPQRLEVMLGGLGVDLPVYNSGVSGYSMRQIRETAALLLPELQPRVVVVGVFGSRAGRIENPYVVVGDNLVRASVADRIVPVEGGFLSPAWSGPLGVVQTACDRWFHFCAHLLRSVAPGPEPAANTREEFVAPLLDELDVLAGLTTEHGAELWVVQVVTQDDDGGIGGFEGAYSEIVGRWCAEKGIPCVDSGALLASATDGAGDMRLGTDRHWSPKAHDLVAAALAQQLVPRLGAASPSAEEDEAAAE